MFQKGIVVWMLMLATVAWSQEAPSSFKGVKKQRVSPKLLREAMALPEYKGQAPAEPPVTLEHVHKLSEKLKADGDSDNAELLQRLIREHRRLVNQSALTSTSSRDAVELRFDTIDVNIDDLPPDSMFRKIDNSARPSDLLPDIAKLRKELSHLIELKKAKLFHSPVTIVTQFNESARCASLEEFSVPLPGPDGRVIHEVREFGTTVEVIASSIANDRIKLQITGEIAEKDMQNMIMNIPGVWKNHTETVIDVNPGETHVIKIDMAEKGHKFFVFVKATPQ